LEESQLSPEHLELKITESIIQNMDSIELLNNIKKIGVKISIDDFGTGYSSLSVLKHLPLDYLKIDRSFINDLTTDSTSNAIVKTIINLGHDLGFKIIAEGIENIQQLNHLKNLKCDIAQGYYFSVPLPEKQIYDHINKSHGTM
jgi:EAL domain-containing protein (putative c-di-GMP-specific phosphodiesterase class I)